MILMEKLLHIVDRVEIKKKENFRISTNSLIADDDDEDTSISTHESYVERLDDDRPKKRGRPPKKQTNDTMVAPLAAHEQTPLNSDMSYRSTYQETNDMLHNTISQIDFVNNKLLADMDLVRSLRDKKKWEYVGDITSTSAGLIGNKISAIKEINGIITKCHDLEMKKMKDLKMNEDGDDDKKIMDLYNAYINTPIGSVPVPSGYNFSQGDLMTSGMGLPINNNLQVVDNDPGYEEYIKNLSPVQNAMIMEQNPNIKTVLVYDQSDQSRHFEVMDVQTGQTIPNMPIPTDDILEGTVPDIVHGTARNAQFNMNFQLKIVGQRGSMDEY